MANFDGAELHNLVLKQGRYQVRDGLRAHTTATAIQAGSTFVGGFSVEGGNTGEVFHYLINRATSGICTLRVCTEEFRVIASLDIGRIDVAKPAITHAITSEQILINSPHMSFPVYGLVGGGVKLAEKQDSVNEINTSSIQIPRGICCNFGDRVAIAQGKSVYFSDGGTEPRTFVGINVISFPSPVYDLMQSAGGSLFIVTAQDIYVLPADAASTDQAVFGFISTIKGYQAVGHRNVCMTARGPIGLTQDGVASIGQTIDSIPLTSYRRSRYLAENVGAGSYGDFRRGTIWQTQRGFVASIDGRLCSYDGKASWIYNSGDLELVGVLRTKLGGELYLTSTHLLEPIGNQEFTGSEITGVACIEVPTPPTASPVVREITTSADNVGAAQKIYVNGQTRTATTPKPTGADTVIGTSLWGTENFEVSEIRSRRHQVAVRSDDLSIEVAAVGCGTQLGEYEIKTAGKGKQRASN